jgi:uncharacterized repeat protein (TIGR01451 family)
MMSSQVSARIFLTRATVSALALFTAISPGFAAITNTVTASGTNPTGAAVTATDTENVAPEIAAPALSVNKTSSFTDTGSVGAEVGDVITYTYVVTNNGNVPVSAISLSDSDNATGTDPVPAFQSLTNTSGNSVNGQTGDTDVNVIDLLWPGDSATFTSTYTVNQTDVDTLQ